MNNSQSSQGNDIYYDPKFRAIVEDHLDILKTHRVTVNEIPMDLFWQYEGNFYGYLTHIGIPISRHWILLRVNNMHAPTEFASILRNDNNPIHRPILIQYSEDFLGDLQKYYMSRKF